MSYTPPTGWERLGSIGRDKMLTQLPKGMAPEGIYFALKVKKAAWIEGQYGYRYHLDVVVRTIDLQTVLGSMLWKLYPSMLPDDITDAIDTDTFDENWFLINTVVNANSKADPPRTKFNLIDVQEGMHSLQTHPPPQETPLPPVSSPGGSPTSPEPITQGAGDAHSVSTAHDADSAPPADPPHCPKCGAQATDFQGQWVHCGERVG